MRRTRLALPVILALFSGALVADPFPASVYTSPRVGTPTAVAGVTVKPSANMTITLESGSAAPLFAGDRQIGIFFSGKGQYEYRSVDASESSILNFEAKKASDLKISEADGARVLKGDFERVAIRAANIALPDLAAGGGTALAEQWDKHVDQWNRRFYQPDIHTFVAQQIDAPERPAAVIDFSGGSGNVTYLLDPTEKRSEALISYHKSRTVRPLASHIWPTVISEQAVGRNRREFSEPRYLLTNLDYTLVADEDENATLSIVETIVPFGVAQRAFRFDLHSTVYDSNEGARQYQVRSVKDASGADVPFEHSDGSLLVVLPKKAPADQPLQLRFEIAGRFLYRPNGDSFWQLGTEPWFPQPDLNGQFYTVHSTLKVKKPFVPFTPGDTVRRVEENGYNVVETKLDKPVQFAVAHAGKYSFEEKKYEDGITVRIASYAGHNDRAMKQLNNLAWKLIKYYEPWLGPFPFKEFNIIEIAQLGWGQAPPATMFITKEAFNPTMGEDNQFFSRGINHRFAHEIAHQYWGHVVKMSSGEEQWITESFAEYSAALAMKQLKGKNEYDKLFATWKANANDSTQISPISLANRIDIPSDPFAAMVHRNNLIYDKGAYLLGVLHKQVGDDKFLTLLRNLQRLHEWKFLSTVDVARLMQRVDGGKDYMPYFEQNYWGTGMPKP